MIAKFQGQTPHSHLLSCPHSKRGHPRWSNWQSQCDVQRAPSDGLGNQTDEPTGEKYVDGTFKHSMNDSFSAFLLDGSKLWIRRKKPPGWRPELGRQRRLPTLNLSSILRNAPHHQSDFL